MLKVIMRISEEKTFQTFISHILSLEKIFQSQINDLKSDNVFDLKVFNLMIILIFGVFISFFHYLPSLFDISTESPW